MTERAQYGVYANVDNLAGMTIAEVRKRYAQNWGIPTTAIAFCGTTPLAENFVIPAGAIIEFHQAGLSPATRSKTICCIDSCGADVTVQHRGEGYCQHHFEQVMLACGTARRPHDWLLDSTQVFSTSKGPVIRALYSCVLCGEGVVARPGETPDQAVIQRMRERLHKIEKLLEA